MHRDSSLVYIWKIGYFHLSYQQSRDGRSFLQGSKKKKRKKRSGRALEMMNAHRPRAPAPYFPNETSHWLPASSGTLSCPSRPRLVSLPLSPASHFVPLSLLLSSCAFTLYVQQYIFYLRYWHLKSHFLAVHSFLSLSARCSRIESVGFRCITGTSRFPNLWFLRHWSRSPHR